MKLEQQVCSLELAKRLKELGVNQDSLFFWMSTDLIEKQLVNAYTAAHNYKKEPDRFKIYSAFTVAELGEMLPIGVYTWKYKEEDDIAWAGKIPKEDNAFGAYNNEADARAKMCIYLLENKLI